VDAVMAYYVVGTVYKDLEKLDEAERYFNTGINLNLEHTSTWSGRIYAGLTSVYTTLERYDEALVYAFKGLEILRNGGNKIAESRVLTEIGLLYKKQKDYEHALHYFNEGLKLREQSGYEQFKMSSLSEIADLYKETGKKELAIEYLKQAEEIAMQIKREVKQAQICKDIGEIYKALNDHQQALDYFEKYMRIGSALNKQETEKKISEMQHGILKEKEDEIERLRNVELKRAYEIISERNKEITDSINYAKRIQQSVLPVKEVIHEYLEDYFLLFKPKDIVSGDFYWATHKVQGDKEYFYLAVADSTGHGVPGAFMSLLNITFLNEAVNEKDILEPHLILNHVRERLIHSISRDGGKDGMDCILICIDIKTKQITFASANNAPVLISSHQIMHLHADKMPVGKGEKVDAFKLNTIDALQGDVLYLYTDGYADQFGGPKGKKFKYKQLDELLLSISGRDMGEQEQILDQRFEEWKGELEQVDDVCIIGIRL
ncbi:MAG TPA: SpoIIE family protein phosphatase, partial [Bacteroidia bacterium]